MRSLLIVLSLILFTGCAPKVRTANPEVTGSVIDAFTHEPVKGVEIVETPQKLESGVQLKIKDFQQTATDEEGKFILEETNELGMTFIVSGPYPLHTNFKVNHDNYLKRECECFVLSNTDVGCNKVTVTLIPNNGLDAQPIKYFGTRDFSCNTHISLQKDVYKQFLQLSKYLKVVDDKTAVNERELILFKQLADGVDRYFIDLLDHKLFLEKVNEEVFLRVKDIDYHDVSHERNNKYVDSYDEVKFNVEISEKKFASLKTILSNINKQFDKLAKTSHNVY